MYSDRKNKTVCESSYVSDRKSAYNSYRHEKSLLSPTITSTPIHSFPMNNRRSVSAKYRNIRRSKYLLSDNTAQTLNGSSSKHFSQVVSPTTGPLLASTNYNVNLSTYLECKSPGIVERVVQYNEERNKQHSTSYSKYNSPGLFPIVHLTKRNTPVVSPKSRRVTVRIASSDYSPYMSPKENSNNLDDTVQDVCGSHSMVSSNNHSTRSVLDALKEISRKRILPRDEYRINEGTVKRTRSENIIGSADNTKRSREDKSSLDGSFEQQTRKKCNIDPHFASQSSVLFYNQLLQKLKTVEKKELVESPKADVSTNIDVQTQTVSTNTESPAASETPSEENQEKTPDKKVEEQSSESESDEQETIKPSEIKQRKPTLRIFDERPLEAMRKKRLASILTALSGEDPILLDTDQVDGSDKKDESDGSTTVSINASVSTTPFTTQETSIIVATTTTVTQQRNSPQITQTFTSLVTPVMSTSAGQQFTASNNLSQTNLTSSHGNLPPSFDTTNKSHVNIVSSAPISATISTPASIFTLQNKDDNNKVNLQTSITQSSQAATNNTLNIQFKPPASTTSNNNNTNNNMFSSAFTNIATNNDQLKVTSTSTNVTNSNQPSFNTLASKEMNKTDNFLFNSQKSVPVTSSSVNSFSPPSTSNNLFTNTNTFNNKNMFTKPQTTTTTHLSFPSVTSTLNPGVNSLFGNVIASTTSTTNSSAPPSFSFSSSNQNTTKPISFPIQTTSVAAPPFGSSITTTANPSPAFSFGTVSSNNNEKTFNVSAVNTTAVTTTPAFGMTSTVTPATFNKGGFSFASNNPNNFANTTQTTKPSSVSTGNNIFGNKTSFPAFTASPGFNSNTTTKLENTNKFGGFGESAPIFDKQNASKPSFGNQQKYVFSLPPYTNNTTAPTTQAGMFTFGSNNNNQQTTGGFGANPPQTTSGFGSNTQPTSTGGFGSNIQTNNFGTNPQQTTNTFGSPSQPSTGGFGVTSTQPSTGGFGSIGQPSTGGFGSNTQPNLGGFGSTNPQISSGFGSSGSFNTNNQRSGFGTSNPLSTSGFGGGTTQASTNIFGSNTQTTTAGLVSSTGGFGSTPQLSTGGFGSTTQPSSGGFGSTTQSSTGGFGTTPQPSSGGFGTNAQPSSGGFGTTAQPLTSGFSSTTKPSTGGFGSSTGGGFGSTAQPSTGGFGAPVQPSTGGFSFGSAEPPKSGFNFTSGPSNTTSFNSTNPPAFGAGATSPSFNSVQNLQFNAPGTPGMFNIGAGTTPNRPRKLIAKRRTDK